MPETNPYDWFPPPQTSFVEMMEVAEARRSESSPDAPICIREIDPEGTE